MTAELPIAIIGAGPIGLAAAAHLLARGETIRVFEKCDKIASNLRDWSHVRLFSVWEQCVDEAAVALLTAHGWKLPSPSELPTGGDLVTQYLEPLAAVLAMAQVIETGTAVVRVTRSGLDRVTTKGREQRPFALTLRDRSGTERIFEARAVIDASGTWQNPNPLGAGWAVPGEDEARGAIAYGIPDISGAQRQNYANKHTLVVGGGHSAANALLDLAYLAESEPATRMTWAVRGQSLSKVFGGGDSDQLPARGQLGQRLKGLADMKRLTIVTGFSAEAVRDRNGQVSIDGRQNGTARSIGPVDRVVVATGQRPDFAFARELQLDLHPIVESTRELGPLIDPNEHSCGTVPPHGWRELAHTEPGYFVVGIKSYGRAPTFLLLTGYEQVRSVAAYLAGDMAAANDVRLVLPETGICNATLDQVAPGDACCTSALPSAAEPCCARPAGELDTVCCASATPKVTTARKPKSCCGASTDKHPTELVPA